MQNNSRAQAEYKASIMESVPLSSTRFSDTVNRIVLRVVCTEGHEDSTSHNRASDSGPLTLPELTELSLLCSALNDTHSASEDNFGFASVEADQLLALLEVLDRHINIAVAIDFIRDALEILRSEDGRSEALDQVGTSLKTSMACYMATHIAIPFLVAPKNGFIQNPSSQKWAGGCFYSSFYRIKPRSGPPCFER